jgi:hypothetical protein
MRSGILGCLVLALAFALSACGSPFVDMIPGGSPNPHQALVDELDRNVARWVDAGISRYAFVYRPSCFCDTTPHLVIVDGAIVRIDGEDVDARQALRDWIPVGVPGLFQIVRTAIDGDHVTTTYDPVTGVPVSMDSDPMENAIDDELSFTVGDWTLDAPDDSLLARVTQAKRQWIGRGIARYTMTLRVACICVHDGRTFTMTFGDGDIEVRSSGGKIDLEDLEGIPLGVDSLFQVAARSATVSRTTVDFDADYGYPRRIVVAQAPGVAGPDESFEVVGFTVP